MKQLGTSGGNLFVGGHLYLEEDFNFNGSSGNVYLSNMDDFTPSDKIHSWLDSGSYSTPDSPSPLFTKSEIIDKLNTAIGSNSYPKWIPEVETEAVVNIAFNSNWQDIPDPYDSGKIIPNSSRVFESEALKYSETNKSCIIGNIYDVGDKTVVPQIPWYNGDGTIGGYGDNSWAAYGNYYIIIDTGDNPNNVFTVRLLANRDFVNGVESPEDNRAEKYDNDPANKEENETFSWAPYPNNLTFGGKFTNVLIKGRGTVIFDIPEGVTYQASTFEFVGHMNWYALSSMGNDFKNNSAKDNVLKLVHTSCTGSNACDYTDKYDDGKPVEGGFWCKTHECVVESTAESVEKLKDSFEDGVCLCHNRVGRKEIDAIPKPDVKVTSAGTDYELVDYVGEGDARTFVYPTTNVWFVSCDENAEIRLSETIDGLGIMHDNTFGFIYAPYMTFSAKTFDLTGGLRMVGGLIVSDLLMSDFYTFLYVAPEKNYADLLGDNAPSLLPQGNRTWRKYGY
ncbi:MAG: hypothetical protein K2O14_13115 [Oscillospiraceae bacterium]|nr:hypothetical protein [Oscillospiraceae bacterium]